MPGSMRLTFLVCLSAVALQFVTLCKLELTTKRAAGRLRRQTRDRAPATPEAPPSARPSRTFERRPRTDAPPVLR